MLGASWPPANWQQRRNKMQINQKNTTAERGTRPTGDQPSQHSPLSLFSLVYQVIKRQTLAGRRLIRRITVIMLQFIVIFYRQNAFWIYYN